LRKSLSRRDVLTGSLGFALVGPEALAAAGAAPAAAAALEARPGQPLHFEVTRPTLTVPGLDARHDGLRVAQLSDIHVGVETPEERVVRAVEAVNAFQPDLLLLTGDYVTFNREPLERLPVLMAGLAPSIPVFAVLGNHDYDAGAAEVRGVLEGLGYAVLVNAHTRVHVRGAPLTVLGVDEGLHKHDDVAATFKGAPSTGSRLVLAHTPPTARKLPAREGLVCFSGHTHGGSVMIPGVTHAISTLWGQPYVRGHFALDGRQPLGNQLYVNRGIGFGNGHLWAPRFNSAPEVSLFTLRAAGPEGVRQA
jgi:predicted MPP superfamily phosphohydrolase